MIHSLIEAVQQNGLEDHFWRVLEIPVPIMVLIWKNKRQAKKDVEKRHEENQKLINGLVTERKYFRTHAHGEKQGALTVDGISYAPDNHNPPVSQSS